MSGLGGLAPLATAWSAWLPGALLQTTVVALLVLLAVRFGKRLSSPLRYGLVCVALLKFLVPTALTLPIGLAAWAPLAAFTAGASAGAPLPAATATNRPHPRDGAAGRVTPEGMMNAPRSTGRRRAGDGAPPAGPATASPRATITERSDRLPAPGGTPASVSTVQALFLVHLTGALAMALWAFRSRRRLRAILQRCTPVTDDPLLALHRSESRHAGLRQPPALLLSPDGFGPAATGLWRRRTILPAATARDLPAARLRPILAHEIAHHRRLDVWVDAGIIGLAHVWWFHPAFWLVAGQLRRLREDCCDELVLAGGDTSNETYCQLLLDVAATLRHRRPAGVGLSNGSLTHPLARRIARMMNRSFSPSPRLSRRGVATLALAGLVLLPGTPGRAAATSAPAVSPTPAEAIGEPQFLERLVQRWRGDDLADLSRREIDALVRRGLDRDFVAARRDEGDRTVGIDELRSWTRFGVEAGLVSELAAQRIDTMEVSELFRIIRLGVDGRYLADLRQIGYDRLAVADIIHLARYEVDAAFITSFRDVGYQDLTFDEMVRLRRYEVEPGFVGALQQTGYADLDVDDLVALKRYEVEADYIQDLSALGYDDLEVDELIRLQRYEVGATFIEALGELGRRDLSIDDLVRLHRYEVDPRFVAAVNDLGYTDLGAEGLVQLKRYEVDLDTMRGLQELGLADTSVGDMVRLTRYGVDLEYVTAMRQIGVATPSTDDLITLQRYEVGPDYVAALAAVGYTGLEVQELVNLRRYGVEATFMAELAAAGIRDLDVDDLVRLRRYEVEPAYVEGLERLGFDELSVDDVIRLHRYEVEVEFIERLQRAGFEDLTVDKIIAIKRHS